MTLTRFFMPRTGGSLVALSMALAIGGVMTPAMLAAQSTSGTAKVDNALVLSVGGSRVVNLPSKMSDVVIGDPAVVDVHVRSENQLYIIAKAPGETNVFATAANGKVLYSGTVRVGNNLTNIGQMLTLAMPDAQITSSTMNGMVLLTGTVKAPEDAAEAERLVEAFVGEKTKVISRLRTATPLQVNLHVKFAEVSRSLLKEIGANTAARKFGDGGSLFNFNRNPGRVDISSIDTRNLPVLDASSTFDLPAGSVFLPFDTATGKFVGASATTKFINPAEGNTLNIAARLFGFDFATALDLAERQGLISTLSEPNLTALSGETASFLAGGEFPVPLSTGLGNVSIEYKNYGVSLAFTPTVLGDGRISMRVRPEVSELSSEGAVTLNGFRVPALTTRRAETTVELGSGQSFMIAGLMRNISQDSLEKTPGLGDVPVLGNLFKSTGYQKNQTELVIIVTPYLVKPVNASDIVLPTDGYRNATDGQRLLGGMIHDGVNGGDRPKPSMAPPVTVPADRGPDLGAATTRPAPVQQAMNNKTSRKKKGEPVAAPGFSF